MNTNQKPVVNVPKKSNNIAMIIGVTVLVCCVCCVFIIFRARSRSSSTKGADIIVKDMEVETITSTPSTESSTRTSTGGDDPKPLSTKPMKVQLYKTYDCSGEPIDAVSLNSVPLETEVKIDKRDKGDEYFACCMKTENADVHATYTTGRGDEKSEHTLNLKDSVKIILTKDHRPPNRSSRPPPSTERYRPPPPPRSGSFFGTRFSPPTPGPPRPTGPPRAAGPPPGVSNEQVHCAQNLYIKASPHK